MKIKLNFKSEIFIYLLSVFLLFGGCFKGLVTPSYYILDYTPDVSSFAERDSIPAVPYNFNVEVTDFKIPRTYDRRQIVSRKSAHRINYLKTSIWAVRPQIIIADLLNSHLNAYKIFKNTRREYLDTRPEYIVSGYIYQIEVYQSQTAQGNVYTTHIKMKIELIDNKDFKVVLTHEFDEKATLPSPSMDVFAMTISNMIRAETDSFISKVLGYLKNKYPEKELQR